MEKGGYLRTKKIGKKISFFSPDFYETERSEGKVLFDEKSFIYQYFFQELSSTKNRLQKIETEVNLLKTTRPHIEQPGNQLDALFQNLLENIGNLLSNFNNLDLRLNNFIDFKDTLIKLNQEARKFGDVYLLRSIVIFYDSIKHSFAEELNENQLNTIKEVGEIISSKSIGRNEFKEIYKKLLDSGFQIVPEPAS